MVGIATGIVIISRFVLPRMVPKNRRPEIHSYLSTTKISLNFPGVNVGYINAAAVEHSTKADGSNTPPVTFKTPHTEIFFLEKGTKRKILINLNQTVRSKVHICSSPAHATTTATKCSSATSSATQGTCSCFSLSTLRLYH